MSNNLYNILKQLAQLWLPASATLYAALAGIWGFPYGDEIVGTIVAINTFIGAGLGISSYNYKKEYNIETRKIEDEEENEDTDDSEDV